MKYCEDIVSNSWVFLLLLLLFWTVLPWRPKSNNDFYINKNIFEKMAELWVKWCLCLKFRVVRSIVLENKVRSVKIVHAKKEYFWLCSWFSLKNVRKWKELPEGFCLFILSGEE